MDDLVERLQRSWDVDRSIISQTSAWDKQRKESAAEITRLRARLAEMEADLAYTNKRLEHAFERNERQAQTIDALTVALATARADAVEVFNYVAEYSNDPHLVQWAAINARAMKDAKP
jgi:septal ring factor EnvC (AmiA/AmiB activator)